ncbi:MAG TPA: alpha/beta hydrolase [Chitinophagaceae bacterium]
MKKRVFKRIAWILLTLFLLMNISAYMHAYKFTHFSKADKNRTEEPRKLSFTGKIKALFLGINNPRPELSAFPSQQFETITLQSNKLVECWRIKKDSSKGTVILFHGYRGDKSSMIDKSDEFLKMGYSTLLVDFMGSGGSEGNQTTIGFKEAEQVKTAFEYLKNLDEKNIFLFGTSMGAVAILRAIDKYQIQPAGIIIECPFGTMYQTTTARFKTMGVPSFPMAGLLVFWGGVQNGFWGFSHDPVRYAKSVECPSLLLYGEKDEKVSMGEIQSIFNNLPGRKSLKTYPGAGHENYLLKYKKEWVADVSGFLSANKQ